MAKKQDLSKLRAAWENQQTGGGSGGGGFRYWKPRDDGEYTIRFLPPHDPDGLFFKQTAQYKLGDKYFFAPYIDGEPDPIYDYYRALWKKNTPESIAIAKDLKPRKQYLYNIIVRDENGAKPENPTRVYVYMSGQKLYDKVMHYFWDEDFGDLTDIEEGYDFKIVKEPGSMGFPNYDNSRPRSKASALFPDTEMVNEVLGAIHDLNKEVEYKSYDELKQELANFLASKNDTENFLEAADHPPVKPAAKPAAPAAKPVASKLTAKPADDEDETLDDFEKKLMAEIEDE